MGLRTDAGRCGGRVWGCQRHQWASIQRAPSAAARHRPMRCAAAGPDVGHSSTVWEVAFDGEGRRMVSCSDDCTLKLWACRKEAGEQRWQLLTTLAGYHDRTIFTVDWSRSNGLIASGSADNAIRIFGEAGGSGGGGEAAATPAAGAAAAEPGMRGLFLKQQAGGSGSGGTFDLLCKREQAHPLDINCVRWHPHDPSLLASAGDDCCIRLWRWLPGAAAA